MVKNSQLTKGEKLKAFIKNNAYFIVLGFALAIFALTLIITSLVSKPTNPNEDPLVNTDPIVAMLPMQNAIITKGFSATELQFNETFEQWEAHKAIDFKATDSLNVCSILDGTVLSITSSLNEGTTITISHADGYKSVYSSLAKEVHVSVGQTVTRGQLIGEASASAQSESLEGAHLHFELYKSDKKTDPANLLDLENK